MKRFENKVVLVTGGARGQGEAEVRLFAAEGAKVVIADASWISHQRRSDTCWIWHMILKLKREPVFWAKQ